MAIIALAALAQGIFGLSLWCMRAPRSAASKRRFASLNWSVSFAMRILRPRQTFESIGRCIYCGAADGPLGDEHIIPRSIGGALLFKDASCRDCEGKINAFEGYCTSHMMGPFRRRSGLPLRNRDVKRWPDKVPFWIIREDDTREEKMIPWQEVPRYLYLPALPEADVLFGGRSPATPYMWLASNNEDRERVQQQYGGAGFTLGYYDVEKFCRFVAKIAHSYVIGQWGNSFYASYRPLLPDFIRFGTGDPRTYVGGDLVLPTENPSLYNVGVYHQGGPSQDRYICAFVRIFSFAPTPLYHAAVGEKL